MPWYPRRVARAAMVRLRLLWPDGQVGERLPISQWLVGNLMLRHCFLNPAVPEHMGGAWQW